MAGGGNFNLLLNAEAYVSGSAGAGFLISSKGFTTAGNSGGTCTGTDSSTCTTPVTIIPQISLPPITIAAGVTVAVTGNVLGAAVYSGSVTGAMQFGAKAGVEDAKLGGKLTVGNFAKDFATCFPSSYSESGCITALKTAVTPYTTFPLTYAAVPFSLSLTSAPTASIDASLWSTTTLTLNSIVPFTSSTKYRFSTAYVPGTKATSRALRYGPRMLDSVTTCPSTAAMTTIDQQPSTTSMTVGPTTMTDVYDALRFSSTIKSAMGGLISGSTKIIPQFSAGVSTADSAQNLIAACVASGTPLTGSAGGAGSTPVTSSGGGGGSSTTGSGGGGTSAAAGAAASTTSNVGLALGLGLGLGGGLLIIGAYYYFVITKHPMPRNPFTKGQAVMPAAAAPAAAAAAAPAAAVAAPLKMPAKA